MQHGTRPRASVPGRSCCRPKRHIAPSDRTPMVSALGAVIDVVEAVPEIQLR